MSTEQWCSGKAYAYHWTLRHTKHSVLVTVATYNNSTTRRSVPDASSGPPQYSKSQQSLARKPLLFMDFSLVLARACDIKHVWAQCHSYWNQVHKRHDQVHLAVRWCRSCTRPSPTSPDGSKVTYAVKKTEQEMAWEWGYSVSPVKECTQPVKRGSVIITTTIMGESSTLKPTKWDIIGNQAAA